MFFLFEARLEKPPEMSRTDFYDLWRKDAGSDRLMVVFDMASRDRIDALMQELPIWTLAAQHIARAVTWPPLRDRAHWSEDLKALFAPHLTRPPPTRPCTPALISRERRGGIQ